MKSRSFKKFFASIALSAVLTLSSASSVFAATAQLVPAEPSVELAQSDDSDIPAIESSDAQNAGASLTAQCSAIIAALEYCTFPIAGFSIGVEITTRQGAP